MCFPVTPVTPVTKERAKTKNGFSGIEPKAELMAQSDPARNGSEPLWLRFTVNAERVSRTAPTFPRGAIRRSQGLEPLPREIITDTA